MSILKIGVSGDAGSFSEEAGIEYSKKINLDETDYKIVHLIDMDGVLSALNLGNIDIGVFGVANHNSGLVWPAFMAMSKYQFKLIDEIHLDVGQCLFAKSALNLKEISKIYSYTPALNQCKNFLKYKMNNIATEDFGDMAKAARALANGELANNSAIIGSSRAAEIYNLQIIAENIQDTKPNITMFAVVTAI